ADPYGAPPPGGDRFAAPTPGGDRFAAPPPGGDRFAAPPPGDPYAAPPPGNGFAGPYRRPEAASAPPRRTSSAVGRHYVRPDESRRWPLDEPGRGPRDDGRETWRSRVRQTRKNMPLWQELPLLLIVAFCLAVLVRTFLVQAFFIPSGSMEDTLLVGDRVLVNKIVYDVRTPKRGEVIVFSGPANWAPENVTDVSPG